MTVRPHRLAALALALLLGACQSAPQAERSAGGDPAGLCGGIGGLRCAAGKYCHVPDGRCRTVADASGVCESRPEVCPMIYQPVCGCDGKTYPNACHAAMAGVSVAATGACKP